MKNVSTWANEKTWMMQEVSEKLKVRSTAFKCGDEAALRTGRANPQSANHAHAGKL